MSSRHRKSRLRLALSRGVVGGDVKCTERALQDVTNCRFAQPASSATEEFSSSTTNTDVKLTHCTWTEVVKSGQTIIICIIHT